MENKGLAIESYGPNDVDKVESMFSHLLTTNELPSETDRQRVIRTVSSMDAGVQRTMRSLREMIRQRERLFSVTSLVRKIPPEIFGEIFAQCLPKIGGRSADILCLLRVCKRWRETAFATPRLWTYLTHSMIADAHRRPITQWLTRAGSLGGLHVDLRVPFALGDISFLNQFIPRMHTLVLDAGHTQLSVIKGLNLVNCPELEVFQLICYRIVEPDIPLTAMIPQNAPRLRKLKIGACGSMECAAKNDLPATLPFSCLTDLNISTPLMVSQCAHILRQAPNLVHCSFWSYESSPGIAQSPIRLENLQTFKHNFVGDVSSLVESLTLPSLTEFHYRHYGSGGIWSPMSVYVDLFARSAPCQVEQLTILEGEPVPTADVTSFLEHTPKVTSLILINSACTLDILIWLKASPLLHPHLVHLDVTISFGSRVYGRPILPLILDFIDSRWWPDSGTARHCRRLEKVVITNDEPESQIKPSLRARINQLRQEGLCIEIDSV